MNNWKLKWLKHVKREIHQFQTVHGVAKRMGPGLPATKFANDRDTLIEQSNIKAVSNYASYIQSLLHCDIIIDVIE